MSETEDRQPCALFDSRERAAEAVARLAEQGIEAEIEAPGARYHGIPPGCWQLSTPASQAARARAILDGLRR